MELTQVETLARRLMTEHGVGTLKFSFDGAKRRLGYCERVRVNGVWVSTRISLSRHYVEILPEDEIREVILHEIAHALTPGHNHNAVWKAAARRIGATGDRCVAPSAAPEKAVTAKCPECGESLAAQHRLPTVLYVCRQHRNRTLTWYRNGSKVALADMPATYRQKHQWALQNGRIQ